MISEKQRRKALARAKWERQQARRTAAEQRNRRLQIILGAAVGVVVVVLGTLWVANLVTDDGSSPRQNPNFTPVFPSNTGITFKTPTNGSFYTSHSAGTPSDTTSPTGTRGTETTKATKPTATTTKTTATKTSGKGSR